MRSVFSVGILGQALGQDFDFNEQKHACGVCMEMRDTGVPCDFFGACDVVGPSVANGCEAFCGVAAAPKATADLPDLRVTKGFGTKEYDLVRVSVVTGSATPPVSGFFDYSSTFEHRWGDKFLHTAMKQVAPGEATSFDVGVDLQVRLPAQGAGVAGVLIADPCLGKGSVIGYVGCFNAKKFQTNTRIVELVNTFVPDEATDFWGIFGDNFYDRTGEISTDVFSRISLEAKSKLFASVPGNHDYWVLGSPLVATTKDQCGNGHMQFYAQDAKAAESHVVGTAGAPFNFSIDPSAGRPLGTGCNIPAIQNSFWYNQVGNLGMVGQSGAYSLEETRPFMQEACSWLAQQPGLEVAMLIGHWDDAGLGADANMAMPAWYSEMAALPGCDELDQKGMLKFVMGHTHCNDPHPHGKEGAGFRVAGFGMEGCNNFGMPLVDTTSGRVRFWYFDTSTDDTYDAVIACVGQKGWRQCTDLATLWLDEPIGSASTVKAIAI